jgi:hypothetical protein
MTHSPSIFKESFLTFCLAIDTYIYIHILIYKYSSCVFSILIRMNGDWFLSFFYSYSFSRWSYFISYTKFHFFSPFTHIKLIYIYIFLRYFAFLFFHLIYSFSVLFLLALSRSITSWIIWDNIRIVYVLPKGIKWKYWKRKKLKRVNVYAYVELSREITMLQFALIHSLASSMHFSIFFIFLLLLRLRLILSSITSDFSHVVIWSLRTYMYVSDRRLNDYAKVDEYIKVYVCMLYKKAKLNAWSQIPIVWIQRRQRLIVHVKHEQHNNNTHTQK